MTRGSFLRWLQYIFNRPFFILLGGTGFAQLIAFVSSPLLTRLYEPDAFGLLSIFGTSLAVVGAIAGGRYEQAIIGESANKFADLLVILAAFFSLLLAIFLPFIAPFILPLIKAPTHIADAITYLAPATFAYVVGQALTNWLVRNGGFSITSSGKVIQALTVLGVSLFLAGTDKGLITASMAGYLCGSMALAFGAWRMGWLREPIKPGDLPVLARRHINFPLFGALPALFDSLSMLLPVYWVAIQFSATDTGQFGLSRQILAAPIGLFSLVVAQLLMKRLADAKAAEASMLPALRRALFLICGPALALGLILSLIAPELFARLFGEVWRPAGSISRWMVWAFIAPLLVSPLSSVLIILRKVGSNGVWQILHCAGLFLLISFSSFTSIEQFVQALVIFELISYGVYAALIAYVTYGYEKNRRTE